MEKAIAERTAKLAEEMGEKGVAEMANECKILATNEMHEHMCKRMGLRKYVELVLADYQEEVDSVDKQALSVKFNLIMEKARADAKFDDLGHIPKSLQLATKQKVDPVTKKPILPVIDVSSKAVRDFLNGLLECIALRQEAHFVWQSPHVKDLMYKARTWTRENDKKAPSAKDDRTSEERKLRTRLNEWKKKRTDLEACDVVMRGVTWWREFAHFDDVRRERLEALCDQLRAGYGLPEEDRYPGYKKMSRDTNNKPVSCLLWDVQRGLQPEVAKMVFDLFEKLGRFERLRWFKSMYNAARGA
jgi:hypothetical protein